ncbi:MAG: TIM barrel protein [Clostridia bacterium]|nr:TIM barrel protein [Clostridia bacterium]
MSKNDKIIRFGPAGNSEEFYNQGHKSSVEAPKWIFEYGLNAFEYSFGRGVKLNEEMAEQIKAETERYNIALSVHAPYYINFATFETEKIEKNRQYVLDTFRLAKIMGATRVTIHPGSCAKVERKKAFNQNLNAFKAIYDELLKLGYDDIIPCPETMGRENQLGTVDEIIEMANIDKRIIPTIDFGHVNAITQGGLKTQDDFKSLLDKLENGLGAERVQNLHCHFSRIEYTAKGEKCHLTYDDNRFGPDFEPLAKEFKRRGLTPRIICESKGTMARDARIFKDIYDRI